MRVHVPMTLRRRVKVHERFANAKLFRIIQVPYFCHL